MEKVLLKPQVNHELAGFLKRNLIYDILSDFIVEEKIWGDPYYSDDMAEVMIEGGEIVAFAFGVVSDITGVGHIKFLVVDKHHRGKKVASGLLESLEEKFKQQGATSVQFDGCIPNYLNPGLDPRYTEGYVFLLRRGYEKVGDAHHMEANLDQDFDTKIREEELISEGIRTFRATPEDKERTMEFLRQDFPGWCAEVSNTFRNSPVTLHLASKGDKIIAFSAYDGNNVGIGWFGPMGTTPECRGLGIGGILLKRCLHDQKLQGHKTAIIPWVGPTGFYLNEVDAKISRIFWLMKKKL